MTNEGPSPMEQPKTLQEMIAGVVSAIEVCETVRETLDIPEVAAYYKACEEILFTNSRMEGEEGFVAAHEQSIRAQVMKYLPYIISERHFEYGKRALDEYIHGDPEIGCVDAYKCNFRTLEEINSFITFVNALLNEFNVNLSFDLQVEISNE